MSQESKRKRRKFTQQFKQDAVDFIVKQGYSFQAAAGAVNVGEGSLRLWYKQLAPKLTPCGDDASLEELRAEKKRLRRERERSLNRILRARIG